MATWRALAAAGSPEPDLTLLDAEADDEQDLRRLVAEFRIAAAEARVLAQRPLDPGAPV